MVNNKESELSVTDSQSAYMDTAEVQRRIPVSKATLSQWRKVNRGPVSVRLGGRILYPRAEFERWMAEIAATARGEAV